MWGVEGEAEDSRRPWELAVRICGVSLGGEQVREARAEVGEGGWKGRSELGSGSPPTSCHE